MPGDLLRQLNEFFHAECLGTETGIEIKYIRIEAGYREIFQRISQGFPALAESGPDNNTVQIRIRE